MAKNMTCNMDNIQIMKTVSVRTVIAEIIVYYASESI